MKRRLAPRLRFVAVALAGLMLIVGCGQSKAPLNTTLPVAQDVPKLMQMLESKKRTDRAAAASYLAALAEKGQLGDQSQAALTKLQELAQKDKEETVKRAAADAIAKFQGSGG
ncbi:MAG: HEAT repeat domain-containing protein [Pirellulales bacterium]|nr:HEAT repeat domain-containing protein [Pirellulales bacterium]